MSSAESQKPPYVLLSDRLPPSTTSKLLGRIVADPLFPRDEFVPDNPRVVLREQPLEVLDSNVQITLEANCDGGVQAKLYKLLQLEASRGSSNVADFKSNRVITRSLEQHRFAWDVIYANHKEEIVKMLSSKQCRGTGYMIVAIKSFVDAESEYEKGNQNTITAKTELPIAETANAVNANIQILPHDANPKITVERSFNASWLQKNVADGEQVFAIRYRVIKLKRARFRRNGDEKAEYGDIHRVDKGHGLMSGESDEEEFELDDEGDEEGDKNETAEEVEFIDGDPSFSESIIRVS